MRSILVTIFILTFFSSISPLLAADGSPAIKKIFFGALPAGWTLEEWGGCELTERKGAAGDPSMKHGMPEGSGDGPSSSPAAAVYTGGMHTVRAPAEAKSFLALLPKENATPWCGGTVATPSLSATIPDPIALPPEFFDRTFLVFKLNGLADEFDRPSGGQPLQVSIGERIKDTGPWPECWQNGGYVDIHGFLKGGTIDNDLDTWQEVRIPLRMLTDAKNLRFLGRVAFQFIGAPPNAGVAITDIAIEIF